MITFDKVSKHYSSQINTGNTLRTFFSFSSLFSGNKSEVFSALNDVSFTIDQGESVGIIGRNGAGKSTLLKLLTRVIRPSAGRICAEGSIASLLEVGAGFHHDLTGRENIYLAGTILGMSRRIINRTFLDIAEFSEIDSALEQPVRTYSSGMFLRLAFSVGIHLPCDILVIDEALAVGDRYFQERCYEKINHFHRAGGTVVVVSHDEEQLKSVCQRGIVLSQGEVIYDGSLSSAMQCYSSI